VHGLDVAIWRAPVARARAGLGVLLHQLLKVGQLLADLVVVLVVEGPLAARGGSRVDRLLRDDDLDAGTALSLPRRTWWRTAVDAAVKPVDLVLAVEDDRHTALT
jgi:hypothetical protein